LSDLHVPLLRGGWGYCGKFLLPGKGASGVGHSLVATERIAQSKLGRNTKKPHFPRK